MNYCAVIDKKKNNRLKLLIFNYKFIILCKLTNNCHGNARVPGGLRGLQIRSVLTIVKIGGFDSHTFPLYFVV